MKKPISIVFVLLLFILTTKINAQILSVAPDTAILGQTLEIEVTAENVDFTQGTNVIELERGEIKLYPYNSVNSSSSLTFIASFQPNFPTGNYNLSILNTAIDTTFTKENALYLRPNNPECLNRQH